MQYTSTWRQIKKYRFFYILILTGMLYYLFFHYLPMYGIIIAFKNINPFDSVQTILKANWVGFSHFKKFFTSYYFWNLMGNTLAIGGLRILCGFPVPIILALLLNELRNIRFKKLVQTVSYLPHFISTVVLAGLVVTLTSTSSGAINQIILKLGGEAVNFMGDPRVFRGTLIVSNIWKEAGWGTIIYMAAMSGVNPELYEAAMVDGCGKFKQMLNITLPGIAGTISIMLIMSVGSFLNAGFEQILLMYSPSVYEVADIIDTYVFREGLLNLNYSFSAAVGLFKSIIAMILLLTSNTVARKLGQPGIW